MFQFIQKPGEVLYLPHGYPHTVHNLEDNMALTNNALFPDALSSLVNVLALKKISSSEEMLTRGQVTRLEDPLKVQN